ncbi:MAG: hypothetical protein Q8Q23_04030 [bacterium]|nr:hypothetical protein [bacterium]
MDHLIKIRWLRGSFENSDWKKKLNNLSKISQRENLIIIKPSSGNLHQCDNIINNAIISGFAIRVYS